MIQYIGHSYSSNRGEVFCTIESDPRVCYLRIRDNNSFGSKSGPYWTGFYPVPKCYPLIKVSEDKDHGYLGRIVKRSRKIAE